MIISDLNYLETVSAQDNLLRGSGYYKKTVVVGSSIWQSNSNGTLQVALSSGFAANFNGTYQSNNISA